MSWLVTCVVWPLQQLARQFQATCSGLPHLFEMEGRDGEMACQWPTNMTQRDQERSQARAGWEPGIHADFDDLNTANVGPAGTETVATVSLSIAKSSKSNEDSDGGHSVDCCGETIEFPLPAAPLRWCHCVCGSQTHGKVCNPFAWRPAGGEWHWGCAFTLKL